MEEILDLWRKFVLVAGIFLVSLGGALLTVTIRAANDLGKWTQGLTLTAVREGSLVFLGLLFISLLVGERISRCRAAR